MWARRGPVAPSRTSRYAASTASGRARVLELEPGLHGRAEPGPRFGVALLDPVRAPVAGAQVDSRGREEELRTGPGQPGGRVARLLPVRRADDAAVAQRVGEVVVDPREELAVTGHVDEDRGDVPRERAEVVVGGDLVVIARALAEGRVAGRGQRHDLDVLRPAL